MKRALLLVGLLGIALTSFLSAQGGSPTYKAKRINKAIELLEAKQPVWFTGAIGERDYEDGKKMAQTYADYIDYPLEHEPFDMPKLRRFMQGLVDGGPTKSGHRTPAVIATLPVLGITEAQTRAGDWMVNQVLAAGVHGIMFCRARNAGSVRAVLEAARWPFHKQGVGRGGLQEGYRGSGSQTFAATIWGMSPQECQESDSPNTAQATLDCLMTACAAHRAGRPLRRLPGSRRRCWHIEGGYWPLRKLPASSSWTPVSLSKTSTPG
jgi:hypothetical protein